MARDGSRSYEYNADKMRSIQLAIKIRKQEIARRQRGEPLLPNPPSAPDVIQKTNEQIMAREFTPLIDHYAEIILRMAEIPEINDAHDLPRILCRKSGVEIGRVSPSQYAIMRAIWPAMDIETAEEIISKCGLIAPQYIFTMPQAWQVMAATDPAATLTLALEIGLRANWSAQDKASRNDAWIETSNDDDEALLIAFELASDLMRISRDWVMVNHVGNIAAKIKNCMDIHELIELLKSAAHIVAKDIHPYLRNIHAIKTSRMEELFARYGVVLMQRRKPIIGEAELARRVIGMYYNDFKFLTARLTNAQLLNIIGNATTFEAKAERAFKLGHKPQHPGLERYRREIEADESRVTLDQLAEMFAPEMPAPETVPSSQRIADMQSKGLQSLKAWAKNKA